MSRKQFIESHGATCKNCQWSWSFVNHAEKYVIFGAWDKDTEGNTSLILSKEWKFGQKGNRLPGYGQSREHVRLIEESGYRLKTFPIIHSDEAKDAGGIGPEKIKSFIPELRDKKLIRVGDNWYASDGRLGYQLPQELDSEKRYVEGAAKSIEVNTYERNGDARNKCIKHHGHRCSVCNFDFKEFYGSIGDNFIEIHHIVPLSEIGREYVLDPIKDLIPVCPNCHAMIHRTWPALSVEQLREYI